MPFTTLMPSPRQRFYTNTGTPAAFHKLYTYGAGTTANKAAYQDAAGTVPHENPITLDAKGEALIYFSGAYKIDLKDSAGTQITGYPVDNFNTQISSAELASDVGAGKVGFSDAETYPPGSIGERISDLSIPAAPSTISFSPDVPGGVPTTVWAKLRQVKHVNDWGGDLKVALTNCNPYTAILLDAKQYNIAGLYSNDLSAGPIIGNTKRGVVLIGAGEARVNAAGTAMEGGTIIQGTLLNLAHDFKCFDLSIDVGEEVCSTFYGGAYAEGFIPGMNTSFPTPQPTIDGVQVDRVSALGRKPTGAFQTWKHTMLFENLGAPTIGSIKATGGYHVFVDKCVDLQCSSLIVRGGAEGDSIQFNSNAANRCWYSQYGNVHVDSWMLNGVEQKAGAIVYYSDSNVAPFLTKHKIGNLMVRNMAPNVDVFKFDGNSFITDCAIGHLDADISSGSAAVFRAGYGATRIHRFVIGTHNIVTSGRTFELGSNCSEINIGSGVQTITADALNPIMVFNAASYSHGRIQMAIIAAQSAPYMISRTAGDVLMGSITFSGAANIPPSRLLSSTPGSLTRNTTNFADAALVGGAALGAKYVPYRVQFTGSAKALVAGSDLNLGTVVPAPLVNLGIVASVESTGAVWSSRTLEITTAGAVVVRGSVAINDVIRLDGISFDALTRQ